jgi:beta-lactamase regulating signal transducer with metallopeptidase domain
MSPRDLLVALIRSSLEGGALLLALWIVGRMWPRMPASARRWLWWLGSLRLVLGLAPIPRLAMSLRPAWNETAATVVSAASAPVTAVGSLIATPLAATREAVADRVDLWVYVPLVIWGIGVLLSLATTIRRMLELRRLWQAAPAFTDVRVLRWRADWALVLGHARTPEIRVSDRTPVPLAVGMRRPGILLPAGSERLTEDALRLVLAHELSHLRRRDPLLGCLPALAETLFWFHPLARLASREYLSAREELCDSDALHATSASPRDYGELLLDFAVGRHTVLPGCASCGTPAGRRLKRRLEMLSNPTPRSPSRTLAVAAVATTFLLIGFAPVRLAAHEHDSDMAVHAKDKPSSMGYMLKTAGKDGTRGSMDIPFDLPAAKDLDRWDLTALYFRFGSERWITTDEQTITDARKAIEEEDRLTQRETEVDQQRDELEKSEAQIEARHDQLKSQEQELRHQKSKLEDRRQELVDAGKSTDGVEVEISHLERQIDALSEPFDQLARARAKLQLSRKEYEAWDKAIAAENESIERHTEEQIGRIGRQAIDRGVAVSYRPGSKPPAR